MYYITKKQSPRFHQVTIDELFNTNSDYVPSGTTYDSTGTMTVATEKVPERLANAVDARALTAKLIEFNHKYANLLITDLHKQYYCFKIPKHSGGMRTISAPRESLKAAQYELKRLLEDCFGAKTLFHTAAFAYVPERSNKKALMRHQSNESKWFAKLDFSDFFGSVNQRYTMSILSKVYPFCVCMGDRVFKQELNKALSICFLDDKLPQGTPISPLLTNIIMIPLDFEICKALRGFQGSNFVYTRYADDMTISCRYKFSLEKITGLVERIVKDFDAPFKLNKDKSRLGSASGRNFNIGLMLNQNNEITVGNRRIKQFESMLYQFCIDWRNGNRWNLEDTQHLQGLIAYYQMIYRDESNKSAPTKIDGIINHYSSKQGLDVRECIRAILRS